MNSKKVFFGLVGILILIGAGLLLSVYLANHVLADKSTQLVSLKAKDGQLAEQQVQIARDKKDLAKYAALNNIAKTVVPQDKDQALAVRQITALATKSGIPQISSISFSASTLGTPTSSSLTQVTAVPTIPGVYDLPITITQQSNQEIPYANFLAFLSRLEQNRRTAQVSSVTVTPDTKKPNVVYFTIIVNEYIKP